MNVKRSLVGLIALTFVGLFAGVWLVIAWKVWHYTPTTAHKQLPLSDALVTTAGFLAATVGAGTASVLGITVAQVTNQPPGDAPTTLATRLAGAAVESWLVVVGVAAYFLVGVALLVVWLLNPDESPEAMTTFAFGILGWAGGTFSAVFRSQG